MAGAESHRWVVHWPHRRVWGFLCLTAAGLAHAAQPNDDFANATVLTGSTNYVITDNAGATFEQGEPEHANLAGGKSLWWTWQAPFTGSVGVSTEGSAFDTLLAVYTGDALTNLQIVADNDDADGFGVVISSLVFRAIAGETYRIAVDGYNGVNGAIRLAIGRTGYPAPAWSLVDLDGHTVNSTDFQPKVLVVDFWETTCGACVDELPDLIRLYQTYAPAGLSFFGVSKDEKSVDVKSWVQIHNIPYDIAKRTEEMEDSFGGDVALPTKFVIDRENMIVGKYVGGGVDYTYYEKIVKPLLRGSKEVPLRVRRQAGALVFAWPAAEFGYNLESTSAFGGTNWTTTSLPVTTTNDQNTVTIPVSGGAQFFRLRKTPAP